MISITTTSKEVITSLYINIELKGQNTIDELKKGMNQIQAHMQNPQFYPNQETHMFITQLYNQLKGKA